MTGRGGYVSLYAIETRLGFSSNFDTVDGDVIDNGGTVYSTDQDFMQDDYVAPVLTAGVLGVCVVCV